jgi:hypothetical protein
LGSLELLYNFEGADDSARLADSSANGYTLQRLNGADGGDINNIQFVVGFDGVSQAYQPSFDTSNYRIGAGLNTISTAVSISQTITVETVFQLDSYAAVSGTVSAYLLSARPAPSNGRAYFMRQLETDRLASTMGDTFGDQLDIISPYNEGDWYYVAMVASYNSGANQTTVDFYGANLSASETTLNLLASDSALFQGDWSGTGQVGVGNFLNGTQEYLQGRIDNVALFNELLDPSTLQEHLDALYIPEPTTLSLLGLGSLALVMRRRRR